MATAKTPAKKTTTAAKTSKAPAAKTTKAPAAAKAPAKAAAPAKKPATAKAPSPAAKSRKAVPPEQRRNYVEVAAYFIAERHGFTPGRELADWAAAEAEIDRLLTEGLLNP